MATPGHTEDMNLLLVGRTGSGKSSSGNIILGRKSFESRSSSSSVTKQCQVDYAKLLGRTVKVVDGPGLGDTEMHDEDTLAMVIREGKRAVAACPEGYHAVLVVIKWGRLTKEDKQTLHQLKAIIGKEFLRKYGVMLVTHGDIYEKENNEGKKFHEWCAEQEGLFKKILTECCQRAVLFNNKSTEEKAKKEQLKNLFKIVDDLKFVPNRYLGEDFLSAQRTRDYVMAEGKEAMVREETLKTSRLIIQELEQGALDEPDNAVEKLKAVKCQVQHLSESVREQDKGTGALSEVMELVNVVCASVTEKLGFATQTIHSERRVRELTNELEEMNQEKEKENAELQKQLEDNKEMMEKILEEWEKKKKEMERRYQVVSTDQVNKWLDCIRKGVCIIGQAAKMSVDLALEIKKLQN